MVFYIQNEGDKNLFESTLFCARNDEIIEVFREESILVKTIAQKAEAFLKTIKVGFVNGIQNKQV